MPLTGADRDRGDRRDIDADIAHELLAGKSDLVEAEV
jgi:hypothetical protein